MRSQGYTLVAKSEFKTLEDMKFYDADCEAHQSLKVRFIPPVIMVQNRSIGPVVAWRRVEERLRGAEAMKLLKLTLKSTGWC